MNQFNKYWHLFQNMTDGVATVDMQGTITENNPAFEKMLGYEHQEILSLTYNDITPQKWHEMEAKIIKEEVMVKGYSHPYEKEYIHKNGIIFPVMITTYLMKDDQGKPSSMWTIVRNLTKEKEAWKDMIESEARLQSTFEAMEDLVFVFDTDSRFVFYHAPKSLLLVPPEEFLGKKHSQVLPEIIDTLFSAAFEKNRRGETGEFEYSMTISGENRWFMAKLSPIVTDGEFKGSVAVVRDVTSYKKIQDDLKNKSEDVEKLKKLLAQNNISI